MIHSKRKREVGPATVAQAEALKALKADRRKPRETDAPPLSTFPGPKAKALPGQLEIGGEG